MTRTNLVARSLNDLGTAAWFGGVLMGATAANRAAADITDETDRGRVVNGVWRRWWPVNALAIGAHLAGGTLLTIGNRERVVAQRGVASLSTVKAALTIAAVGTAAYSGWLGKRISDAGAVPLADGTSSSDATPPAVASALRQQRLLQWAIPALTGVLIVLNAAQGEQQRPLNVARGVLGRLNPAA
ncbi:MAG: hypothetical protein ABW219_09190 [Ilumatobacteraceae bacterium]